MNYLHPLEARAVLLFKYTCYECLYHWWGCCWASSLVSTLAALVRLLVSAEVRHFGGGLVPQELINLLIEQSCPVWDKGSSYQNKM